MGGNAKSRSNHLTWEKVPPPRGGGALWEISVKSRFESKFSVKSPVYFWVENLGQNAIWVENEAPRKPRNRVFQCNNDEKVLKIFSRCARLSNMII